LTPGWALPCAARWPSAPAACCWQARPLPRTNRQWPPKSPRIALKTIPGKVTKVVIEKKKGKNVYVVEIMTEKKGEIDVFVDIVSGKVIGTD
jgi:hypothetical protein